MIEHIINNYIPQVLPGLVLTLEIVIISVSLGSVSGIILVVMRNSGIFLLKLLSQIVSTVFRGTPLLAQLYLVYFGSGVFRADLEQIGLWWLFGDGFYCSLLVFTINSSAYQAEIYQGALLGVPKSQLEAAQSLGLSKFAIMVKVIMPQAALLALRPLGNETILMMKASSIVSIISLLDIMGLTKIYYAKTYDVGVYYFAAVVYLVIVEIIRRSWSFLETRLTRHTVLGRKDQEHKTVKLKL